MEINQINQQLLTKEQAATFLQVSYPALNRLIKKGIITPVRLGRNVRFTKEALENPSIKETPKQ